MNLERIKAKAAGLQADYDHARKRMKEEKATLRSAKVDLDDTTQAQQILQQVAQTVEQQAHKRISAVVSKCLKAVFGKNAYEFKIVFEKKRGKTEARLVFMRDGHEVHPTGAGGGGVLDVAAMALRLAALILTMPPKRRLLVLDEPFKMTDKTKTKIIGRMLEALSKEMKLQIILVTHSEGLEVGKVVKLP